MGAKVNGLKELREELDPLEVRRLSAGDGTQGHGLCPGSDAATRGDAHCRGRSGAGSPRP